MKDENKFSIQQVHQMLEERAGYAIPNAHLKVLLAGWRYQRGYKTRGRQGWLSVRDAHDFLKYAY